jgi:AcrR family transcriptional regulator
MKKHAMKTNAPERPSRMSRERRRQQLLDTAIDLFAQKGFNGTTTKEIAAAAGITQAVIFQHFTNKDELYAAILNHKMLQGEAEFLQNMERSARRKNDRAVLRSLALHIMQYYLRDPSYMRLLLYSGLEGHELAILFMKHDGVPLNTFLSHYIEQRIKDGVFRRVKPVVAARAFLGMIYNHVLVRVLFDDPILKISPENAVNEFVNIFLGGVRRH